MKSPQSPFPPNSFIGEACFSKVTDYIDTLAALEIGPSPSTRLKFVSRKSGAEAFTRAAETCKQYEDMQLEVPLELPIAATGDDPAMRHPLNWLNITECKRTDEKRSGHEWYICLDDGVLTLTFEHGKFGYRKETCLTWSAAFARLAELMAGTCSWQEFGDSESRNTLLGKGQFYWSKPGTREHVPVDNFVFIDANQRQLTIAGVSHRCALSLNAGEHDDSEWYDDYAEALLRVADILDDRVALDEFGKAGAPNKHKNAGGVLASGISTSTWLSHGQFVVKSIYSYEDVLRAPLLVYKTYEGAQVELDTTLPDWTLRVSNLRQAWKTLRFPDGVTSDALRVLAHVLNGSLLWEDIANDA